MRAMAVACPVSSQAQYIRPNLTIEVPSIETNWPTQMRVNTDIPFRFSCSFI
jgi:hypothetical protein